MKWPKTAIRIALPARIRDSDLLFLIRLVSTRGLSRCLVHYVVVRCCTRTFAGTWPLEDDWSEGTARRVRQSIGLAARFVFKPACDTVPLSFGPDRSAFDESLPASTDGPRIRCYDCYRPVSLCFCDAIPTVDNRTEVLILQHMRERFHPFNTARIVRKALANADLLVDHNTALAEKLASMSLGERVGVLYPSSESRLLSDLKPDEKPDQLIVIDGTWHHAKTLMRDIPRLATLPHFQLRPTSPGRYRIRREPNEQALSTLEATVAAIRDLEPETTGLPELIAAFDSMVQTQLDHPKADYGWRENRRRSKNAMGIPLAILHDLQNVVVAYGESEPGKAGCKRSPRGSDPRQPVYWVAERLGTGESMRAWIQPRVKLDEAFLGHVGFQSHAWNQALSTDAFIQAWNHFLQPDDTVVTFHASTMRLLRNIDALPPKNGILKSVKFDASGQHATLDSFLRAAGLSTPPAKHPGRAGQRLSNAIALVQHLHKIGQQEKEA